MYKVCLLLLLILPLKSVAQLRSEGSRNGSQDTPMKSLAIKSDFEVSNLQGNVYAFTTADSTLSLSDILSKLPSFRLIDHEIPDMGMDNRYHWVKFRVSNATGKPQELVSYLHLNELSDLSFYVVNDSSQVIYQKEHLNNKTHIDKKPIPTFYFAFPVSLSANQNVTVFLRIYRKAGNVVFPLRLFSRNAFFHFKTHYDFFAYLSYGLLAFTFLLSGTLFFFTQYKLLYFYAGYCLFYLILCLSNEGILLQYFHVNYSSFEDNARMIFSGLLIYFILCFSILFLKIQDYAPRWITNSMATLPYFMMAVTVCTLFIPVGPIYTFLFGSSVIISLLVVLLLIFYGMIKRRREAFIYFLAIIPFFTNSVWFVLVLCFDFKASWFYYQTILYQTIFEFVILGIELGYQLVNDRNSYLQRLNQLQWNFTTSIVEAQDSERERIASDLHDDLGGTIATLRRRVSDIKLRLTNPEIIKELDELDPLIQKSGDDLRRISHNLMPPEFARIGLLNSLMQLVATIPKAPTQFEFLTAGIEKKLPTEIELTTYRIVSELIQNVLKHSKAKHASVQMIFFHEELRIIVEDDGIGNISPESSSGMGIKNCNLRANYIGAKLTREISRAGTFVVLDIPYTSTPYESVAQDQDTIG